MAKTQEHKKKFGIYYTPSIITHFAAKHLNRYYQDNQNETYNILEPSVGNGEFIMGFLNQNLDQPNFQVDMVDIEYATLNVAKERILSVPKIQAKLKCSNGDFLDYSTNKKYDLVIGNPPYINKKDLTKIQIEKSIKIQSSLIKEKHEFKNIWTAFVFKSLSLLKENGTLCQVLPIELLHVNYTGVLRKYLLEKFKKIEIFTFNEIVFENTQQDIVLLFASNSKKIKHDGVSFFEVNKLTDLEIPDYIEKHSNIHSKNLEKWSNYILSDSDLSFIENLKDHFGFSRIVNYTNKLEVGLVTAANDYFIINDEQTKKYKLQKYVRPIIQKSSYLKNIIFITSDTIKDIKNNGGATNLVAIPDIVFPEENETAIKEYIELGKCLNLHMRYKMRKRKNWYHVPLKWMPDGFLMKRTHTYPKLIVNKDNILSTDALYIIDTHPMYDINNLCASFYNILTFIDCELKGRYYGGGVLELTPNEFKSVEIPYLKRSKSQVKSLITSIETNNTNDIIEYGFKYILKGLSASEIDKLKLIYIKLLSRRHKVNAPNIAASVNGLK